MHLTTKARYAATALLDLALHGKAAGEKAPYEKVATVSLADISRRQGISLSYLEQLFGCLRRSGLVESTRGPGGGYRLGRPPSAISVAMVADAMSENMDATRCQGRGDCQRGETCLTHQLWTDLSGHIHDFLDGISLADLVSRKDLLNVAARQAEKEILAKRPGAEIPASARTLPKVR